VRGLHTGLGKGRRGEEEVIAFSIVLLVAGFTFRFIPYWSGLSLGFLLASTLLAGFGVVEEGVRLLRQGRVSVHLLIATAIFGSFLIGHGEEGAVGILLFRVAEFLEGYATRRAGRAVLRLMEMAPETAVVRRDGREQRVRVEDVRVGEVMLVRPGERIPLDGVVVRGVSSVIQAPITGEAVPVLKQVGDEVYAGTINSDGLLEVKVTKPSSESMLSRILRLVQEAQGRKSSTERFIDRFSRYYTPLVVFLALGVATIPTLIFGLSVNEWVYRALVLLVIGCPCPLVLSTPVAMISSITSAWRNGVLIKGGAYLEEISRIRVFAFDKTGTLTEGRLEVTDILPITRSSREVLSIAASLEAWSPHPIAQAIVSEAEARGIRRVPVDAFKNLPGMGVRGRIGGETYYVGSRRLFQDLSVNLPVEAIERLEGEGKTVVLVGSEGEVIGVIAVADRVRDSAITALKRLREKGIKTVMITGDGERVARAIAERLGIQEFHAGLLPEEKVMVVEELSRRGGVAMVGDGVNDAPALARANVGIAMGAIGSDLSLETADVALMQDDLSKIPYLIDLGRKTLEVVKENIFTVLLVKGGFLILVFPGLITLWLALTAGDVGLLILLMLNSMRLSLIKPD